MTQPPHIWKIKIGIAGNLGTVVANSLDGVFDLFVEDAEDAGEAAGAAAAVAVNETFDANVKVESAIVGTFKGTAPQIGGIIGQSVEQGMTGADAAAGVEKFVNNLIKSTISAEIGTALLQPILAEAGAGVDALLAAQQGIADVQANAAYYDDSSALHQAVVQQDAAIQNLVGIVGKSGDVATEITTILTPLFEAFSTATDEAEAAFEAIDQGQQTNIYADALGKMEWLSTERQGEIFTAAVPKFPGWDESLQTFNSGMTSIVDEVKQQLGVVGSGVSTSLQSVGDQLVNAFKQQEIQVTVNVTAIGGDGSNDITKFYSDMTGTGACCELR